MFGKFIKYFLLDKSGRETWNKMQAGKAARVKSTKQGVEKKPGIPIYNTPFTAMPGEKGIIFPDSNPEEQINLIEMAIGEAKRIEEEPLVQLPPPDPERADKTPSSKKKIVATTNIGVSPIERSLVDVEVGEGAPKEKRLSSNHTNQKIEAIYDAMKVYHSKQSSLAELDVDSRKKLQIMADVMMGNKQ